MPRPTLRFRPDGRFLIAQFTDLHWANGEPEDLQTRALMESVLDAEGPDLAVLTGDVLEGKQCRDPAISWREAVRPLEERGLPRAAVLGNHDDEGPLDRAALMAVQQALPHCLSEPGPDGVAGVGNYWLPVIGKESDEPAASLCFLDSGSYAPNGLGRYAWIERSQIHWFTANPPQVSALVFFHIPVPEFNDVWHFHACLGSTFEDVYCPALNTGFFAAMRQTGQVLGVFVGHDHVNDFAGTLHGIRLCYGRAGGYHTYGREGFPRGARIIELHEGERSFRSWMRLEDGSAVPEGTEHLPEVRRTDSTG